MRTFPRSLTASCANVLLQAYAELTFSFSASALRTQTSKAICCGLLLSTMNDYLLINKCLIFWEIALNNNKNNSS